MPAHQIRMSLPQGLVINSDVEFIVMSGESKLGELHLSRGSIDWRPKRSKKVEYVMRWEKFAELMEEHGRRVERTVR